MDAFTLSPFQEFNSIAEQVDKYVSENESEKAIKYSRRALEQLGEIENIPLNASKVQREYFVDKCDYTYYFADAAFWQLLKQNKRSEAVAYGHKSIEAVRSLMLTGNKSDFIKPETLLKLVFTVGHCESKADDHGAAAETLRFGTQIGNVYSTQSLNTSGKWYLGIIYCKLAEEQLKQLGASSDLLSIQDSRLTGVQLLISGAPSQFSASKAMTGILGEQIYLCLDRWRNEPAKLKEMLVAFTSAIEKHDHHALDLVLAQLYASRSNWEYDFNSISAAIEWNLKALEKYKAGKTSALKLAHMFYGQVFYHIYRNDEEAAAKTRDQMGKMLGEARDTTETTTISGWVTVSNADVCFLRKDKECMLKYYRNVANDSTQNSQNLFQFYNLLNAYKNCAVLEDSEAARKNMLAKLETLVEKAETDEALKPFTEDISALYSVAYHTVHGLYWFDEVEHEPVPEVLTETTLTKLFIYLDFACLRGYSAEITRLEDEILRRGVSREYVESIKWLYADPHTVYATSADARR
jgi:hypothetical protein